MREQGTGRDAIHMSLVRRYDHARILVFRLRPRHAAILGTSDNQCPIPTAGANDEQHIFAQEKQGPELPPENGRFPPRVTTISRTEDGTRVIRRARTEEVV
ncbi:hypothetical protein ACFLSJ_07395 [Verrucomicrobiota bacterium]